MDLPKELVHYTSWEALQSMVETKCFWASHIRFMNDDTEYRHAGPFISSELIPLLESWLKERTAKENIFAADAIKKFGSVQAAVEQEAKIIVDTMYQATDDEFYVLSFCSLPDDEYIKKNGLLSQWRAYGNTAGVAVYFDTEKIKQFFKKEAEAFSYSNSFIDDVVYDDDAKRFEDEMKPKISTLFEFINHIREKGNIDQVNQNLAAKAMSDFTYLSTFLKHRAFKEEKEVRLVASRNVHDERFVAAQKASGSAFLPEKPALFRTKKGVPVRFIKLFESVGEPLPLTRVLIGPGEGKLQMARAAEKLLANQNVQILISDIPLR